MARKVNGSGTGDLAVDTSPEAIELAEEEYEVVMLRKKGMSYRDIARELNMYDRSGRPLGGTVHKMVTRALQRWMREADDEVRELELERLDELTRTIFEVLDGTNPNAKLRAIEQYMRVSERRAKLLGLDAPEKKHVAADIQVEVRVQVADDLGEFLDLLSEVVSSEVATAETIAIESRDISAELMAARALEAAELDD